MPKLTRITLFPIKALDGCDVAEARVLTSGALEHDRRWALVDGQGQFINGKRTPAVHGIRATFGDAFLSVTLAGFGAEATFALPEQAEGVAKYLSEGLGLKCRLFENPGGGFPDDGDAPGPTVVSTASLAATAAWYEGIDVAEMRRRIRANLEIDADEAFWEDRLADEAATPRGFAIGPVIYRGRRICKRCIVPTRDSQSGVGVAGFARTFADRRQRELPPWSPTERFDNFYRLAINTSADWVGGDAVVRVGDELSIRQRPSG